MRALVVSNMRPSAGDPSRGSFVRDQVRALRALSDPDLELETYDFPPGAYASAARDLRRRYRGAGLDVVHAHFGLTAWPALAVPTQVRAVTLHGTDVMHPRTRLATAPVLGLMQIVAAVSAELVAQLPGSRARSRSEAA